MVLNLNSISEVIKEEINKYLTAYHGSNADFNDFDLAYVNTGAKRQDYGYGIYLTFNPEGTKYYGDKRYTVQIPSKKSLYLDEDVILSPSFMNKVLRLIYSYLIKTDKESYSDPYSKNDLLQDLKYSFTPCDGLRLYGTISTYLGDDKLTSEFIYTKLKKIGLKYKIGEFQNVVMFNPNDIQIINKEN